MKKSIIWLAIAALLIALNPTQLKASGDDNLASNESPKSELELIAQPKTGNALLTLPETELAMITSADAAETAYANAQLDRLNEINEMDMSALNSKEKRELRKEVRAIEKQQRDGIYISVGAAILIVLLLILLL